MDQRERFARSELVRTMFIYNRPERWYDSYEYFSDVVVTTRTYPHCTLDLTRSSYTFDKNPPESEDIYSREFPNHVEAARQFINCAWPEESASYLDTVKAEKERLSVILKHRDKGDEDSEAAELLFTTLERAIINTPRNPALDGIVDEILDSPTVLIEQSPPEGKSINSIFQGAAVLGLSALFVKDVGTNPMLVLTLPFGIVLISISLGIGAGAAEKIHQYIVGESKEEKEERKKRIEPRL